MAILADHGSRGNPLQHKRHAEILERLENGEELSIGELAREWNVDPKTIQRDFDKLKQMYPGRVLSGERTKNATINHSLVALKTMGIWFWKCWRAWSKT
jgi:transcriptional regulator GlxA family with amidase domain